MTARNQTITELIESAFNNVRLAGGVSLKQARVIDKYSEGVTVAEFRALPNSEITDDWRAIPFSELDLDPCISHLDAEGFRYYIPALMKSVIERYDSVSMRVIGTLQALYPKKDAWGYHMHRYSRLTESQCFAIASYLEALPQLVDLDSEDTKIVKRALRNYWAQFLPSNS